MQSATGETIQLEERFIQHPALAIEQSRITINSMAAEAQENLAEAIRLLHNYSEEGYRTVEEMENVVDGYEDRLGSYLVKLTGQELITVFAFSKTIWVCGCSRTSGEILTSQ